MLCIFEEAPADGTRDRTRGVRAAERKVTDGAE